MPPNSGGAKGAGLEELEVYIGIRHNTVVNFITTFPIMDLWLEAERRPGDRVMKLWWGQYGLWLAGARGWGYGGKDTEGPD